MPGEQVMLKVKVRDAAILTGDVVDDKGDTIGDFDRIATKAVDDWAGLLSAYGLEIDGH